MEPTVDVLREFGLVTFMVVFGAALAWQGMALLRLFVQKKLNGHLRQEVECPFTAKLDPPWSEVAGDVRDIAAAEDRIQLDIAKGTFTCAWKRDEVTDFKHAIEANTVALKELRSTLERRWG